MAHDSDSNVVSKMACIGMIRQQSNESCGNSQAVPQSLMSQGCALADGIHPPSVRASKMLFTQTNGAEFSGRRGGMTTDKGNILTASREVPSDERTREFARADVAFGSIMTRNQDGPDSACWDIKCHICS